MALDRAPNSPPGVVLQETWRQVVAGFVVVPCVAETALNVISLTPRLHKEGGANYGDGMLWSFTADATSTGSVSAGVGDLPALKVYTNSGALQAGSGVIVSGSKYILVYDPDLDTGAGGFVAFGSIDLSGIYQPAMTSAAMAAAVLPFIYPIDSIYISTNGTNPATTLGFGTWAAFGPGQALVGYSGGDPDFGTDEATGGAKTHALAPNEVPDNITAGNRAAGASQVVNVAAHTGTGDAHNNLQPFIVVRPWKRTA